MRVLVTGANGLVGSRLCPLLESRGHRVVGLSRGPRRAAGTWDYRAVELSDEGQVSEAIAQVLPEVIVHLGSMTDVDACEKDVPSAYAANVDGATFVARAAARSGAHLVHVSTDYVFDGEAGPYAEDAAPHPRGVYATTKLIGELAVKVLAPSYAIARTAVVYGWPAAGRPNFGSWLVGALRSGEPVKLFEDQLVSPTLAGSAAEMLAELAERRLTGLWNTAGGEVVDRVTFGRALCETFGFDPGLLVPTRLKDSKLAGPRPLKSGLKVDKARRELSARPLPLAEALARFHQDCLRA